MTMEPSAGMAETRADALQVSQGRREAGQLVDQGVGHVGTGDGLVAERLHGRGGAALLLAVLDQQGRDQVDHALPFVDRLARVGVGAPHLGKPRTAQFDAVLIE
jgi:hypothetical protein